MRVNLSSLLEFLGALCLGVAAFALDWRAGMALVGVGLIVLSVLVEEPAADVEPAAESSR